MNRCVILQPSFAPWLGVFKLIAEADVFVHYDDVQFDKNGWRNRNRIEERGELAWITIPVRGSTSRQLNQTEINWSGGWESKLRKRLAANWKRRPFGTETLGLVESALDPRPTMLTDLTIPLTESVSEVLGVTPKQGFVRASEVGIGGSRNGRLIALVEALNCSVYRSGPSARAYIDESMFRAHGIAVEWETYGFPRPLAPAFPNASVLDHLSFHWSAASALIMATPYS